MLNRRHFLASSLAAGSMGLSPAMADGDNLDLSVPFYDLPEEFLPREVKLQTVLPAGEIHVDPDHFKLYWTLPDNKAIRYTVGIGKGNLYHAGEYYVAAKKKWPRWTPTPDMLIREPELYNKYKAGLPGGIDNPLGARALYLYTLDNVDSYLRIHGTNDPSTINAAVSNGCARLVNDQIIELYERVPVGTKVMLYPRTGIEAAHS